MATEGDAGAGEDPARERERPASVGEATVTEVTKDDGRRLLLYRWPEPPR
jgi:hypothetical protein